jgi:hypothetical protein
MSLPLTNRRLLVEKRGEAGRRVKRMKRMKRISRLLHARWQNIIFGGTLDGMTVRRKRLVLLGLGLGSPDRMVMVNSRARRERRGQLGKLGRGAGDHGWMGSPY